MRSKPKFLTGGGPDKPEKADSAVEPGTVQYRWRRKSSLPQTVLKVALRDGHTGELFWHEIPDEYQPPPPPLPIPGTPVPTRNPTPLRQKENEMIKRERKTITIDLDLFEMDGLSVTDFQKALAAKLTGVPEDCRFQYDAGWRDESPSTYFQYTRLETTQEAEARVAAEKEWDSKREARERADYERLKARFEPDKA